MHLVGATAVTVGANGCLVVRMGAQRLSFSAPMAFQERGGIRRVIPVAYLVSGSTYGFRLGRHDETQPVVIDPVLESSYVGGTEADRIDAITVLPATGDVLVAGATFSTDLPGTAGGARSESLGDADAFIARFDPTLSNLLRVTYLGGSGGDEILSIAVHPGTGQIYVGGVTSSPDFPGAAGGAQPEFHGYPDGFVARLDPSLTRLYGSTYFGGVYEDRVVAVAVHPATGEIYAAGQTQSPDLSGVEGGAQPAPPGNFDGFVARFDPTLATLIQATYLGGEAPDYLRAMAIHPATGEIYVAGQTESLPDFPASAGGANVSPPGGNGNFDAFLSRFDPTLTQLLQTTFLGGSGGDDILGLAVAPNGDLVAGGWTQSFDFPATGGAAQTVPAGGGDGIEGIVARFDPSLTALLEATYVDGPDDDYVGAIAVNPANGDIYAVGQTYSQDLPGISGGVDGVYGGGGDAFAARLDPGLTQIQTTYLGGSDADAANAAAIDPANGDLLMAGATSSTGFPGAPSGARGAYAGGSAFGGDGFVSRLPASLRSDAVCVPAADPLCAPAGPHARRSPDAAGSEEVCHTVPIVKELRSPKAARAAGTWDRMRAAHLHRRAGFGGSREELDLSVSLGREGAVSRLVDFEAIPIDGLEAYLSLFGFDPGGFGAVPFDREAELRRWWYLRMQYTPRPLEEKMALFWHNHFATSVTKVGEPALMYQQNQIFRSLGMGLFADLLLGRLPRSRDAHLAGQRVERQGPSQRELRPRGDGALHDGAGQLHAERRARVGALADRMDGGSVPELPASPTTPTSTTTARRASSDSSDTSSRKTSSRSWRRGPRPSPSSRRSSRVSSSVATRARSSRTS